MPRSDQRGIAHFLLLLLVVAGIGLGIYLIGQRTNIFPWAASNPVASVCPVSGPCPNASAVADGDSDGDGFTNGQEVFMGTNPNRACPLSPTDDAWPVDTNNNAAVNGSDVSRLVPYISGELPYDKRYDLNQDGVINEAGDVPIIQANFFKTCTPAVGAGYLFKYTPQGSLTAGDTFNVDLLVKTNGQLANTFFANLKFDPSKLEVMNIDMESFQGAFITQVDDLYYNNGTGEISLLGGLPTPGFGSLDAGSTMAKINFRVKATGQTAIGIENNSQIISEDTGTNILVNTENLTLNLGAMPTPTPTPAPSVAPSAAPSIAPSPVPSVAPSTAPSVAPSPTPTPFPTRTVNLVPVGGSPTPGGSGKAVIEVLSLLTNTLTVKISGELKGLKANTVYKVYLCRIDSPLSCGTNALPQIKTDSTGKVTAYATNQFGMNDSTGQHRYYVKVVEEPPVGPLPSAVCTTANPCLEGIYNFFDVASPSPLASPSPAQACALTSVEWVTNSATVKNGDLVTLKVTGNGSCVGKTVKFVIGEDDGPIGADGVSINPVNATFTSGNVATTTWVAEFQQDGFNGFNNPPEFFFTASLEDNSSLLTTPPDKQIKVNNLREGEFLNGDGNRDGKVDILDLAVLRKWWGKTGFPQEIDIDDNGILNTFDLGGLRKILEAKGIIRTPVTGN